MNSSNFIGLNDIETIQVDHNSTCNLRCPQCARIVNGEINKCLPIKTLPLDFYDRVFTRQMFESVQRVFFCGNYGDVAASENILEVCRLLKSRGLKTISITTNGSLREASWWAECAKILAGPTDKVLFSIDGLEDTNHLYRVGSRFSQIMSNAQAFIDAGGNARWEYLVFAHNEHQVEEAQSMAKKMGFKSFKIKKTNRFIQDKEYKSGRAAEKSEVFNKKLNNTYTLSQPALDKNQPLALTNFKNIIQDHGSWNNYINSTPISCKAQKEKTVFIDFNGDLWPCTWLAAPRYFSGDENLQKQQILKLLQIFGESFNNLNSHTFEEILNHPWFAKELTKSWSSRMEDSLPKMMTCGRTCGQSYEFSSNAPENKVIVQF